MHVDKVLLLHGITLQLVLQLPSEALLAVAAILGCIPFVTRIQSKIEPFLTTLELIKMILR